MNIINRQKFLSELGSLLTFMFEEDRQSALDIYSAAFDASEDEEETAKQLVSPTRQAVIIARAYDVRTRTEALDALADGIYSEETPEFINAINNALNRSKPAPAAQKAPSDKRGPSPLDDLDAFVNDVEAGVAEEYEQGEGEDDVESFLNELESESSHNFSTKTVVWALVLFLIFAIPIGLGLVVLMLVLSAVFFALTAASGALGVIAVTAAFNVGFAMIADILVVGGLAVLLLALGLLFLWCAVWFLVGAVPGVIRWVIGLGRKLCVKEVPEYE